jgi:alkane 1-monooxygenase
MFYFHNYFNIFSAPIFCLFALGKGPIYTLIAFALAFIVHPVGDFLMNKYFRDFILKINGESKSRLGYLAPLYLAVPVQMLILFTAFIKGDSSVSEALCSGALCGLSGGILGIATSHELIHRAKKWQRQYGMVMLYTINYPHFYFEHLLHHVHVATTNDPDTALKNESLYRFLLRSIPHGWIKCWKWKAKQKKMLAMTLTQVLIYALVTVIFGVNAGLIFIVQGLVTLVLLKWINYVEHYGLERKIINGKREPVGLHHSWDSTNAVTNFSLFNLGFHTQHHAKPQVDYYELPKYSEVWNELPLGYSAMMILALHPSTWKKVMNQKIEEFA